jgi:hypothetical protein
LVEDQALERELRTQCERLITRLKKPAGGLSLMDILKDKIVPQLRIVDIDRIKPNNVSQYPPKLLMQMCLGYLKLAALDESGEVRAYLVSKKQFLTKIIEEWLQGETPLELESSRVLVKFLSKLEIPNLVLCYWLTV